MTYRFTGWNVIDTPGERVIVSPGGSRPTATAGPIALDAVMWDICRYADGRSAGEVAAHFRSPERGESAIRAALACLAEAGLLKREGVEPPAKPAPEVVEGTETVSVVIVSYNSRRWLEGCLPSLAAQTYRPLDVILVDNGSRDDSAAWTREHFPEARVLRLEQPVSLARAMNLGAAEAAGSVDAPGAYILQLNPDVTLEPDAVAEMVAAARANPQAGVIAAKLRLMWAPAFLNGIGNRVGLSAWGIDNAIGHLDLGQFDDWTEIPSACFAAALIPAAAWKAVGPVDEGFPMYYEDVEWCYRARLMGYKAAAAPRAVVYHAFGGSSETKEKGWKEPPLAPRKLQNVVYGRLRFALKIASPETVGQFIRNYSREDRINAFKALARLRLRTAWAYPAAWLRLLRDLPALRKLRWQVQAARLTPDAALFGLPRPMPDHHIWNGLPELTWPVVSGDYTPLIRSGRTRPMPEFETAPSQPHLLIVSHDVVDTKMAGPGLRYLEMARALAAAGGMDVTLAVPNDTALRVEGVPLVRYWEDRPGSLQVLVENADAALVSGYMPLKFPFLLETRTRLIVDLYDPLVLENLHYYTGEPQAAQDAQNRQVVDVTNTLARLGDFFICGNERQRDLWLGVLMSNGRINPHTYRQDDSLRALIDVVGVGFPSREPVAKPLLRGVDPRVPADGRIVLWGGGIWNWLDPLTLVRAWPAVLERHPEARLVFLGTRHPNPVVPDHEMARRTVALADELGQKDKTILFFEWLSVEDREALLLESDIGAALHPIHVETRYSIRTRVLDYLWARLPVLITEGDVTSEWARAYGVGRVVPPHDPAAAALAINEILDQPKAAFAPAFEPLHREMNWERVVQPLRNYVLTGTRAPDRQASVQPVAAAFAPPAGTGLLGKAAKAGYILRTEGLKPLWRRSIFHLKWLLSRR